MSIEQGAPDLVPPELRTQLGGMVDSFLDWFFQHYYKWNPVNATFTGVHEHDGALPLWDRDALDARAVEMRGLRQCFAPLLSIARSDSRPLAQPRTIDLELADAYLEIQLAEVECDHFVRGNPSLWVGELAFGIVSLTTREFAPAERRAESLLSRLRAAPAFLAAAGETLVPVLRAEWVAKALKEIGGVRLLLGGALDGWLSARVSASLAADVRRAADGTLAALDAFTTHIQSARARDGYACGADLLALLVKRGHWCDRSLDALLADATARLDEACAALDRDAGEVSPDGWPAIQSMLAEQHPTVGEYYASYQRVWDACHALAGERDLVTWPDWPIRYVPIPEHTREAAPHLYYLFYRSPAPFDGMPMHDYVVTPIDATMPSAQQERMLRGTNDSVIKLNHVVHHGAIGHHVQNWFAYHRCESRIGRVAAVDCASRIGMFAGGSMAEGWACYATELMEEVGFLTPIEQVAESHTRVRLLCRAVADLSLHTGRMTLDQAAGLYVQRCGMASEVARNEAVKNSMFPGTALMYWLGTSAIRDLRMRVARERGARFSLRSFHDELLSFGSIPVSMIARLMTGGTP